MGKELYLQNLKDCLSKDLSFNSLISELKSINKQFDIEENPRTSIVHHPALKLTDQGLKNLVIFYIKNIEKSESETVFKKFTLSFDKELNIFSRALGAVQKNMTDINLASNTKEKSLARPSTVRDVKSLNLS